MVEVEGALEGRVLAPTDSGSPDEDPRGLLRVRLGLDLASRVRFETKLTGQAGGSPVDAGAGVFDLDRTFQDLSPSLDVEEAFLDFYFDSIDVRAGLQKFAWGKLDGEQPNDLLNPEKFYDPALEEEDDRKIGVPALSATGALTETYRLTGVWVPIVVPGRFPDIDERWYPPLARPPEESTSMGLRVRNEARVRNGDVPDRDLTEGSIAFRLAGFTEGFDLGFYYFDGYDSAPAFDAEAMGFVRFDPTAPGLFAVRSEIEIVPKFQRVRAAGVDAVYSVLGATIRGEAAWVRERLFPRTVRDIVAEQEVEADAIVGIALLQEQEVPIRLTPVNVARNAVEWGFGGDMLLGDTFLLAQVNQTVVLDNEMDLLLSDWETRFAVNARRGFFGERLEVEASGLYGMQGVYGLAIGTITWQVTGALDLRVGYLAIAGHEESFLGQYRRNDQAFARVRFLF